MSRIEPGFFVQHSVWLPWRRLSPRIWRQDSSRRFESSLIHFTILRNTWTLRVFFCCVQGCQTSLYCGPSANFPWSSTVQGQVWCWATPATKIGLSENRDITMNYPTFRENMCFLDFSCGRGVTKNHSIDKPGTASDTFCVKLHLCGALYSVFLFDKDW